VNEFYTILYYLLKTTIFLFLEDVFTNLKLQHRNCEQQSILNRIRAHHHLTIDILLSPLLEENNPPPTPADMVSPVFLVGFPAESRITIIPQNRGETNSVIREIRYFSRSSVFRKIGITQIVEFHEFGERNRQLKGTYPSYV
jgi:hypothetical protein